MTMMLKDECDCLPDNWMDDDGDSDGDVEDECDDG